MEPLTQYGLMGEKHCRELLPKMVADLEAKGLLQTIPLDAEEKSIQEIDRIRRPLIHEGLAPQQTHRHFYQPQFKEFNETIFNIKNNEQLPSPSDGLSAGGRRTSRVGSTRARAFNRSSHINEGFI
jgi:hypothetical protein